MSCNSLACTELPTQSRDGNQSNAHRPAKPSVAAKPVALWIDDTEFIGPMLLWELCDATDPNPAKLRGRRKPPTEGVNVRHRSWLLTHMTCVAGSGGLGAGGFGVIARGAATGVATRGGGSERGRGAVCVEQGECEIG